MSVNFDAGFVSVKRFHTIVVGSGAAGLNAALCLYKSGVQDVAVITEGLRMGTSRNTGSDKQTYYRLMLGGPLEDSTRKMAKDYFDCGCMDGDVALAEAANSARAFFNLVDVGVPFPHNAYGEYVSYKTDHDPCKRGTSIGPLTSKAMTECLLSAVRRMDIPIFERYQVIELLTNRVAGEKHAVGVLTLNLDELENPGKRYVAFAAMNVIYATGGEAGMYKTSVYPAAQIGGTGTILRAGVVSKNLTESQYGISSVKFRWNLSGTFQQVLPCYVSTDENGQDAREFLDDAFRDPGRLLGAIFLKGYQWPFDPRKIANYGSSLIDLLVYTEIVQKKRRVFLDYRKNPDCADADGKLNFSLLTKEAKAYLDASGAHQDTPYQRLAYMNPAAIQLYLDHGIDLGQEPLEIAVCAQHNNGGVSGNAWWESNIRHLFPIGEVNGSHGVYRPGGSALNAGQVGGLRASQFIAHQQKSEPLTEEQFVALVGKQICAATAYGERALASTDVALDLQQEQDQLKVRMTRYGANIRIRNGVDQAVEEARTQLQKLENAASVPTPTLLPKLYRTRDLCVSHFVYLSAIQDYIEKGGKSRGSYLVYDPVGEKPLPSLPEEFRFSLDNGAFDERIQEIVYQNRRCSATWRARRPIPDASDWFENVWREYRTDDIFKQ